MPDGSERRKSREGGPAFRRGSECRWLKASRSLQVSDGDTYERFEI